MTDVDFSIKEPASIETSTGKGDENLASEKRASDDVVFLVLAYFGIFALIPFFVVKDSEYVRWHAKQGLVLVGFEIVLWIALMIIGFIPILNIIFAFLGLFIWFGILILHVFCIIRALKGEKWHVPVLGKYADKF